MAREGGLTRHELDMTSKWRTCAVGEALDLEVEFTEDDEGALDDAICELVKPLYDLAYYFTAYAKDPQRSRITLNDIDRTIWQLGGPLALSGRIMRKLNATKS